MKKVVSFKRLSACAVLMSLFTAPVIAAPLSQSHSTPADAGVINKEQVLYWLIKRGEVSADASAEEKQAAVNAFVKRGLTANHQPLAIEVRADKVRQARAIAQKSSLQRVSSSLSKVPDQDITKTVNVLGVLVDFPDLPHDKHGLKAADTDMYYSTYPVTHYQNLLFSTAGFSGPSQQTLQSAYQYFQAASGQTFFFKGQVKNWVRATNNAAYYGGNDADTEDDKAVPELVKEAVVKAIEGMTDSELAKYDIEDPYDLDGDGNYDEADGTIDHIMLFHSSIGEEAGGGNLGSDAIWSHRYFVDTDTEGYKIPGKNMKIFGYTVQPIDAGAGVCTHEFSHDLGLPDEYDTSNEGEGSPVGSWSLMSSGGWNGVIAGSQPGGLSPYAKSYLQQRYKGSWVNEQHISLASLSTSGTDFILNHAVESAKVNQLSLAIPAENVKFSAPLTGEYQYYSGQGNQLTQELAFNAALPLNSPLELSFLAHWDIEDAYDYVQVLVDGNSISGNHTKFLNPAIRGANNYLSGKSKLIAGASGADGWVKLTYDLALYMGKSVTIKIVYKTDEAEGGYGIAIDDLALTNNGVAFYNDGAETKDKASLTGFTRIKDERVGKARRYVIQLRSHQGIDAGLAYEKYVPGVLIWLENQNETDNNVYNHPGKSLIGVVDADQNLISNGDTDKQIRDATFSLFAQSTMTGDAHLSAVTMFDDSQDYSAPLKPEAGMILPELGITMEVVEQATNSATATVRFKRSGTVVLPPSTLEATINPIINQANVSFSANVTGGSDYTYAWSFGVANATSTVANPTYTYASSGDYIVTLTVTDSVGATVTTSKTVRISLNPIAGFSFTQTDLTVKLTNSSNNGFGNLTYLWTFGDNATSTAASPSHTYTVAGTFKVTLLVTDTLGKTATVSQDITVTAPTPPVVVTPTDSSSNSGGGGSLGFISTILMGFIGIQRKRRIQSLK